MIFEFNLKLFFVKLIFLFLVIFQFEVLASSKLDCKEKAFYVNNVISDAEHKDLTKAKSKAGYCYIGEDRGYRSCMKIGAGDSCMSGDIFPSQEICVNPNLRQ